MSTRLSKRSRILFAGILIGVLAALPVIAQQTGDQPTKAPAPEPSYYLTRLR